MVRPSEQFHRHPERYARHPERSEGSPAEVLRRPLGPPQDDTHAIRRFFDAIASRYDFLNHFLSFRLDDIWRRRAAELILPPTQPFPLRGEGPGEGRILDLGVGTGKFLALFLEKQPWRCAVGLDFAPAMLARAREELSSDARLLSADFHDLPFREHSFDLVISSFTLRSVRRISVFLKGVYRILTLGGKAAFLCLTRPRNAWFRLLYFPYLKFYLPLMGFLFSGNREAYRFLSDSILSFQEPDETEAMMREVGFTEILVRPFHLGMVTLITGRKTGTKVGEV